MQPYQQASEEIRRQGEMPINALKTAGSIAATGSVAGIGLNRVLPLLNKYIPADLAIKGLSKINPKFGEFINTALKNGTPFEEIKDFIKEKAEGSEEAQKPKENRNIIEQYSPELHQFIDQEIKSGRPALHAGAIAQNDKRFSDVIKKITKDHKSNWSDILQSIYGNGQTAQSNMQQPSPQIGQNPQQIQGMQSQQSQPGQGQQALMAMLQKLQQTRGGQ